ncbi:hypothetical protein B4158_6240 [Bacillus cereus]|nr:hypothetical protein B4158_6240 [Bacillus cereus]
MNGKLQKKKKRNKKFKIEELTFWVNSFVFINGYKIEFLNC